MTTIIINEKTKAGCSLVEFFKNSGYAIVMEPSPAIDSLLKGLAELQKAKASTLEGKPTRKLAEEL